MRDILSAYSSPVSGRASKQPTELTGTLGPKRCGAHGGED